MGSTTTKIIKGNEYLYYVYYENRKKKEVYCGLSSDVKSEKKALQFELEKLKEQKKNLSQKVVEIETKMKSL
ncbi:MAG: hypothetical protein J4F36_11620 [Nitrosopumilaceae archaeon]|nr:hypothetical protein [Nitrosopumilaceae archaeon]